MININIICVGKLKESWLKSASLEYEKRLSAFCSLSIHEIPEEKLKDNPSSSDIQAALLKESSKILNLLDSSYSIALCIEGNKLSSEQLSDRLSCLATNGKSKISFIIGGSFGLSEQVKSRADFKLSMSDMTFPHHLARILLEEQLYRCFSIQNGGKYHK